MINPRPVDFSDPDAVTARSLGYFAASTLPSAEDGTTHSVWTRSLPTALPKTDVVALFDDEGVTPAERLSGEMKRDLIVVPWDALATHLGERLQQRGTRYYVAPEDFPDEATRLALGRPIMRRLDQPKTRDIALRRLMPVIRRDPGIVARAHELGELPVMLLVDPTEEFNWQRLEKARMRVELREQIVFVFLGRVEQRIVYSAEPWMRLLPTN